MSKPSKKTSASKKQQKFRANAKKSVSAKRKTVKEQPCWWALPVSCLMLILLGASLIFAIREVGEYRRFRTMRNAVEEAGFYNGIVVDGYSLSAVTYETAVEHWDTQIEPLYRDRAVTLTTGEKSWTKTASDLGYQSDFREILTNAWTLGREGTLEERYRSINRIMSLTERFEISRDLLDEKALRSWTDDIASSLTTKSVNASVTGFDVQTKKFTFSSSSAGTEVDKDALYASALSAFNSGGGTVNINVKTVNPSVSEKDFDGEFGMITQAVTNASSSNKNRLTNLRLACATINGYCVEPGATFSFNEVVGKRTSSRGYKKATVYQSGEIAEDIGGGVCQVSTTLWNAAMKANCSIVEWHEHSRPVSYVDRGKDATVSWGSQDMKFKNTSDYPMYIVAYVSSNKRVYCEIYGKLFPDGKYITIEAKTTQKIDPPEPLYTYNPLFPEGYQVVITEARTGYKAKAWRVYHNKDGSEIKRELLVEAYYKPARAQIEYG